MLHRYTQIKNADEHRYLSYLMKIGIIGLPNAGKTTIFNALCHTNARVDKYPFTTIEPNVGVVDVPDNRLHEIAEIFKPDRVVPTTIKFLDVAGLVKGASHGEGLGNQFLSNIREVDAIAHVVRCFHDDEVPHNYITLDPRRDIDIINTELMLADLEIIERNIKAKEKSRHSDKNIEHVYSIMVKLKGILSEGRLLFSAGLNDEEMELAGEYGLLTSKPFLYAANIDEDSIGKEIGSVPDDTIIICGKLESEIVKLEPEMQKEFMKDAGIAELGLHKLIKAGYKLLGLVTFFSTEGSIVQAWTIREGAKISKAAGNIHTDMEKGFIKAEVIPFSALVKWNDLHKIKEHGELKIEGKEYVVQDGDIIKVHFH